MVTLLQSSLWRLVMMTVAPEIMSFFGISVFHPAASKYLDNIIRQLLQDHTKAKKYGVLSLSYTSACQGIGCPSIHPTINTTVCWYAGILVFWSISR
jgi:hypothetical protein